MVKKYIQEFMNNKKLTDFTKKQGLHKFQV